MNTRGSQSSQNKMADIVVKNGYNGFDNSKKHSSKSQGKHSSFSNRLVDRLSPLESGKASKSILFSDRERPTSPSLQPSVSDYDTADIVILLDDEVKRIRQLSINLGINHHYEIAQYNNRFHSQKPWRLPKMENSKCWRQSHNWTKRMDEISRLDLRRDVATFDFAGKGKLSVDLNSLPRGRKKLLEPVDIPTLGCSYRLPVLKRDKQKVGKTQ